LSLSVVCAPLSGGDLRDLERAERDLANRTQEVLNAFTHMNGAKAVVETIASAAFLSERCLGWRERQT